MSLGIMILFGLGFLSLTLALLRFKFGIVIIIILIALPFVAMRFFPSDFWTKASELATTGIASIVLFIRRLGS